MARVRDAAQQHLADQREWVKKRHLDSQRAAASNASGPSGLVDEKMLAESMRSVRYKDEGHAAGDIIDNAVEAGASDVHIVFKTKGTNIEAVAFIDNASGIDETFLPHATKWGGSSNEGRRNTFGRFGFGLPSASVNRGRRFEVISRTVSSSPFRAVTVDLDNLVTRDHVVQLPEVTPRSLPDWIVDYVESTPDGEPAFPGGGDAIRTVVIWSNLDRMVWPNRQQAGSRFREHLGITYASWLDVVRIVVDGKPIEPVDVLFTTPGYRLYEIPGYASAEPQSSIKFDVTGNDGEKYPVAVRFSYLSVDAIDAESQPEGKGRPPKVRRKIRTEYNGFFVTRNGRFIELTKPSFLTWNNYARQVGVALDFTPELDELFGVTPDKQTIFFSERVVKLLEANGVKRAFNALLANVAEERHRLKAERDTEDEGASRPSEKAIAKVVEMDVRRTRKADPETIKEGEERLREKAKKLAEETGLPEERILEAQERQRQERPYRVEFARETEDQPFYTPLMDGTQLVLRINTVHPWYREVYSKLETGQTELRSGLELMLWVLAASEIDSNGPTRIFYRAERAEWSRLLANAFDVHPLIFNRAASKEDLYDQDPEPWSEDGDIEAEGS